MVAHGSSTSELDLSASTRLTLRESHQLLVRVRERELNERNRDGRDIDPQPITQTFERKERNPAKMGVEEEKGHQPIFSSLPLPPFFRAHVQVPFGKTSKARQSYFPIAHSMTSKSSLSLSPKPP